MQKHILHILMDSKIFLRKNVSWNHEHSQRAVELLSQHSAEVKRQTIPGKRDKNHKTSSIAMLLHKISPSYLTTVYTSGHPTLKPTQLPGKGKEKREQLIRDMEYEEKLESLD